MRKASLLILIFSFASSTAEGRVRVHVTNWRVTMVNQTVKRVPAHGSVDLCQAIPPITIAPRLRFRGARDGMRLHLRLHPPAHLPRNRVVVLDRRSGRIAPVFTPGTLGLRQGAFESGLNRLEVLRHGRVLARASLRFTNPGGPC